MVFGDPRTFRILAVGILLLMFSSSCRYELGEEQENRNGRAPEAGLDPLFGVFSLSESKAWAVGYYGTIVATEDEGRTWKRLSAGTHEALYGVFFTDTHHGWVSGTNGTLLATADGGLTWVRQETGTRHPVFDIHFVDNERGVAVGLFGTILRTRDGGMSWEDVSLGEDVSLNAVDFVDVSSGWVVGELGTILRTRDFCETWERQESPSGEASLFGVTFQGLEQGWASGIDGIILRTTDGGSHWTLERNPAEDTLFSIQASGERVWAVGVNGAALERDPLTQQWKPLSDLQGLYVCLRSVHFSGGGSGWIVGEEGRVFCTADGARWRLVR